ncbi:MAG: patatin-like phospholipase family protein [Chloroflexota bacterium]
MVIDWQNSLPKPVAFVLSGGAALGSIQVGMLRALLEVGLTPDLIVGTSVGALNGAVIADRGMAEGTKALYEIWETLDRNDIFPGSRLLQLRQYLSTGNSLFSNNNLTKLICRMLQVSQFDALQIPFAALATEMLSKHGALFTEGDIHKALLASTAIPGFFPPVELDQTLYVDGGLTANVPLAAAVRLGAKSLVVLDAGEICHLPEPPDNILEYYDLSLQALFRQRVRIEAPLLAETYPTLYLPTPCPIKSDMLDFTNSSALIEQSYLLAKGFLASEMPPQPGMMTGAPHYHGDEPVFRLTDIKRAV